MNSSYMLFIGVLISNVLSSDIKKIDENKVDIIQKDNDLRKNDILIVKNNNVYDNVNKPNSICVNNVNTKLEDIGKNKNDVLWSKNSYHVNNLCQNHIDTLSSDNFFLGFALDKNQLCKNERIRLKRHLTRKPKTIRPSKTTRKPTKKKKTKTTKIFDLGRTFDMEEFEKYLNEDSHDRKVERDLKKHLGMIESGDNSKEDKKGKTNITDQTKSNATNSNRESNEKNRTLSEGIDSNPMNMTSAEVRELKQFAKNNDKYDDENLTGEYDENGEKEPNSIKDDTYRRNIKTPKEDTQRSQVKEVAKKHREKRAAKKGGKKKKGQRDKNGFDFGFGKKKGTQNKYKQGHKGKAGGGGKGGFGGFGGGGGKKGGGPGGGAKKKKKGGDSSSGEYFNLGDFFQMGGNNDVDDDDDDDDDEEYDEDDSDYYDVDSEEELSHRGGGRGGRNQYKGKNNQNQHHNKNQNKKQNAQEGDGIVREKLTLVEIKDEDDSIFRKRNVYVVSNKKGGKAQQKHNQQQKDNYVQKGPIKMLEYLNDTKFKTNFETYYGQKLKQTPKTNQNNAHRRVKRFAKSKKKAMPKRAKKKKAKNTKRAHDGRIRGKPKKDGAKKRKYGSDSGDTSREKLTITEIKSGEGQEKKTITQQSSTKDTHSEDSVESRISKKSAKKRKKDQSDQSKSSESQSSDQGSDMKCTPKDLDEDSSKSHLSVPEHLVPESHNSKDEETINRYKDINKAFNIDVAKLKEKYEVDSEELRDEMERAKEYFAKEKKILKEKKKKATPKKAKRRGPPTRHTTQKRREKKKVFDYSAEWGDKDKQVKDGIKAMIQELNVSTRCDYCGSGKASIQHVLAGCKMALYFGFYSRRHDRVLKMIRNAFELALDQANRTSGIAPPRPRFGKDAISAENLTILNSQFLTRLRYILSHQPEADNVTRKRGRKSRTTPTLLNISIVGEPFNDLLNTSSVGEPFNDLVNTSSVAEPFNDLLNTSSVGEPFNDLLNGTVNKPFNVHLSGKAFNGHLNTSSVSEPFNAVNNESVSESSELLFKGSVAEALNVKVNKNKENEEFRKGSMEVPSPHEHARIENPVHEITSYEFKMNLQRHSNVFVEPDFSRENPLHPYISNNKVRSILHLADDWQLFSDNRDCRYSFPIKEMQNTSLLKPDLLLLSRRLKYMLIVELTIPWDFNMMRQSSSKSKKYRSLVKALNEAKYNVHFHAVQVGLTGHVGPELELLFSSLGLDKTTRRRYLAEISNSTLQSSLAIWNRKQERKWKFWIFWKKRNQEKYRFKHRGGRKRGRTGGK